MLTDYSAESLRQVGVASVEAVVTMLPDDDDNYTICETVYEHFGTANVIVRLNDDSDARRFRALDVTIIDPRMAMVSLLDQFVRSPAATSLLLGMVEHEEVRDIEVVDPRLQGITLRDLQLPPGVLVLSIRRDGEYLVTHGYTALKVGDKVSVLGSPERLNAVSLRLEA